MPSVQEDRELRHLNRSLEAQGVDAKFDVRVRNKLHQWYKPDGTPHPVLLPADDYNRAVFQGNGWTLLPPRTPVAEQPKGLSPIEQEVARGNQKAREKAAALVAAGISPIAQEVQRETAGVVADKMARQKPEAAPAAGEFQFLAPTPVGAPTPTIATHGEVGDGLCRCGWQSAGNKKRTRGSGLDSHIRSKREQNNG